MKSSMLAKLVVSVVLAVSTVAITRAILGQQPRQGKASPARVSRQFDVSGPVGSADMRAVDPDAIEAAPPGLDDPATLERTLRGRRWGHAMSGMTTEVEGNRVHVWAAARLFQTDPNVRYHWSLFVTSPDFKTRYVRKDYNDQVFSIPLGEDTEPTFEETVTLQPGSYQVKVVLHKFPVGFDPKTLKDDKIERKFYATDRARSFEITP